MSENVIASRKLKAVDSKGKAFDLEIIVGQPYEVDEVQWSCPVSLKGLDNKLDHVSGIDSLQALMLALSLIRVLVEDFVEKGGNIFWFDDSKPASVEELLPMR